MRNLEFKTVLFLVFIIGFQFANAQLTDLARLEYSFIPKSKSEDQYTRLKALINYPIELKKDSYFIIGGEYNRVLLNLEDDYSFETSSIDKIHIIDLNLAYTFKWNQKWRFGIKFNPRIASTLTHKLSSQDYFMNGGVFFINKRTKDETIKRNSRLILGLTYNATTGLPFPLPFISYFRQIDENWTYTAGIPKSNVKYIFNEKNNVQIFTGLDGYLAHLQKPLVINGKEAEHISLSLAVSGLGYEYCFTKHLAAYLYTGYTLRLNNVIRSKNRDEIFKLDDINAFYLRSGLKFKI
ncbi:MULTISPECIES: DUF6268 family outer membrane beta-barrel protein [unclassified Algibacter]|uniref:DUF6268 family outer membrane beta-barrel protein n=1 Tax=unclassified Algibacter TaxID=2615009 RepID=UPI001E3B246D|nr:MULTISPECIES: DUF6268 family outer membrane beta-barrel protein [unclassified Algibacter]MCL5128816.1 DUF6268 family outer membrane beta-barrel protein [Algibacter sp. L4_22]